MFKNIVKISFFGFLLISCSDSDEQIEDLVSIEAPIVNDIDLENMGLKISVDRKEGNIFESLTFKLEQKNQSIYFGDLEEHLDSLVFKISGIKETKRLFEKLESGNSGTTTFNHNFYFPGNYDAGILGYKNGKIIYKNDLQLKITNNRDFLVTNWNSFSENNTIAYHNVLTKNSLTFTNSFDNSYPYILVSNVWENQNNYTNDLIYTMDKDFLYNYFVKLYSIPQYSVSGSQNIKNVYLQSFKKKLNNDVPINIWITPKSKIALLKQFSLTDPSKFYGYIVIAEPNM